MAGECLAAQNRSPKAGIGLFSNKGFADFHIRSFLQSTQVTGQIPVREIELLLKTVEIHPVVHDQNRHDSEPGFVSKGFVPMLNQIFHRSYLKYMKLP